MKDENEFEIRRNRYGDVDMNYYVAKAHKMRDEAIRDMFRAARDRVMQALRVSRRQDAVHGKPHQDTAQSGWPWVDLILRGTADRTPHHS